MTTISDTTSKGRTDPSWNASSTKLCYTLWDTPPTNECWTTHGFQNGFQKYWKVCMVNADGSNLQVIFSSPDDDPLYWLPIWKKDNGDEILVIGVYLKPENNNAGKYTDIFLLKKGGNNEYIAQQYRTDTLNCGWFDYTEVTK
jgi:Tol biopolymer transport system component